MTLRKRLLARGVRKDWLALGLAGVGTQEAMELREKLLREGASKSSVAESLAGVNTKEAEEFRKKHFKPTRMARSYSTDDFIYNGVIRRCGYEK